MIIEIHQVYDTQEFILGSGPRSLKSTTTATMVGGPKEFGGTKAFKPLVRRDVIVSFGPPKIIVLSLKFHHSRSSVHYHVQTAIYLT